MRTIRITGKGKIKLKPDLTRIMQSADSNGRFCGAKRTQCTLNGQTKLYAAKGSLHE